MLPEIHSHTALGPLPAGTERRLAYVASQLEAVWLAHLLKESRGTEGGGLLGKSQGSKMFKELLDETLAQKMAERGVLGLAEALVRQHGPEKTSAVAALPELTKS